MGGKFADTAAEAHKNKVQKAQEEVVTRRHSQAKKKKKSKK